MEKVEKSVKKAPAVHKAHTGAGIKKQGATAMEQWKKTNYLLPHIPMH